MFAQIALKIVHIFDPLSCAAKIIYTLRVYVQSLEMCKKCDQSHE